MTAHPVVSFVMQLFCLAAATLDKSNQLLCNNLATEAAIATAKPWTCPLSPVPANLTLPSLRALRIACFERRRRVVQRAHNKLGGSLHFRLSPATAQTEHQTSEPQDEKGLSSKRCLCKRPLEVDGGEVQLRNFPSNCTC